MLGAAPRFTWRRDHENNPFGSIESRTLALCNRGRPVSVSAARQRLERRGRRGQVSFDLAARTAKVVHRYRNLTSRYYAVLSSCISCKLLHLASQSSAAQGRLESPKIKSGLYTKFQDYGFLQTLESM